MAMQFHTQLAAAAQIAYTTTDNNERKGAEEFITKVKENCKGQLAELGFSYVSSSDVVLQHFGYHLLEDCIDKWWESYDQNSTSDWKKKLMWLGSEMGLCKISSNSIVIQKLAHVTAMVALRLWPLQWEDLIPNLSSLWKTGGEIASEITLRTLISIFNETNIHTYEQNTPFQKVAAAPPNRWDVIPIEATRKANILRALQANSPIIIQNVNSYIAQVINKHLQTGCQFAKRELKLCVELYNETCTKIPITALISSGTTTNWGRLLSSSAVCSDMAQVVRSVVDCVDKLESVTSSVLQFLEHLLKYISSVIKGHADTGHLEQNEEAFSASYLYVLKLVDISITIIRNDVLLRKIIESSSFASSVRDVTISMMIHPSGVVHLNSLVMLKRLLLYKGMATVVFGWGDSEFLLPMLQSTCGPHLVKSYLSTIKKSMRYSHEDFSNDEEEKVHHTYLVSTHKELCVMITAGRPEAVGSFLIAMLSDLLSHHSMPTLADQRGQLGNITTSSETYYYWARAETTLHHLSGNLWLTPQTDRDLANITQTLLTIRISDAIMLSKYMGVLQNVTCLLCKNMSHSDIFGNIVQTLINYMRFPMTADSVASRRKVQTVLIHLSDSLKREMVPHLELFRKAWITYQEEYVLTDQETSLLTETICNTVNLLPELKRKAMVTSLLQPIAEPWSSLRSELFSDPSQFKLFIEGLVSEDQQSQLRIKGLKGKLRKCISILQGIFKRIKPGADMNPTSLNVLDPLLQLVSSLHTVWSPSQLSASASVILTPPNEEKEQCVGGSTGTSNITDPVFHARQYVGQCRASCYCLLGVLGYFYRDDYAAFHRRVAREIFTPSLQNLELLQLKYFWNEFCVPFFLQAPVGCGEVLRESLPQLVSFLYERLNKGWLQWSERNKSSTGSKSITTPGNMSANKITTDEGWELKILTDFTQEIASAFFHIANIALGSEAVNTKLKKFMRSPEDGAILKAACVTMCSDTVLLSPIVSILSAAMCWPAPSASVQAVEALNKIIPAIPQASRASLQDTFLSLLGASLFRVAELQTPDKLKANRESQLLTYCINLITEIYASLLPRQEPGQMLLQMGIPTSTIYELESALTPCGGSGGNARKFRAKFKALLNPPKGQQRIIRSLTQFNPIRLKSQKTNSSADEFQCTLAMGSILS